MTGAGDPARMAKMRTNGARGSSYLEVMVAASILAVALVGTFGAFQTCTVLNRQAREDMLALDAAQAFLEGTKAYTFSETYGHWNGRTFDILGLTPPAGEGAPGLVTVDNANPNLLYIRVRVRWQGDDARAHEFALETYRSGP